MKHLFLFFFISGHLISQNLYFKTKIEIKGSLAIMSKMVNGSSITYQKGSKVRSITKSMGVTQEIISTTDQVIILNKYSPRCAIITKAELAEDSLENDMPTTDIQIEKTKEIDKILEYTCIKTIIRYKIKGLSYETLVWSTMDIPVPKPDIKPLESMKQNSYMESLKHIEGFVMKTETYMNASAVKTIATVIEVNTGNIEDSVFEIKDKSCKDPLNLKEYKKELQRQKATRVTTGSF